MSATTYLSIEESPCLKGQLDTIGAKNAVLVIMTSLILTHGKSTLKNVPRSDDVMQMITLLRSLGAEVVFYEEMHVLEIDTTHLTKFKVSPDIMQKMRASILAMGPLLARFGRADVALPGGCVIGERPIDYHVVNLVKMGVEIDMQGDYLMARAPKLQGRKLILEYPSVGATENLIMAATLAQGTTKIVNAALEPEVLDLITVLKKMGARIAIVPPATIEIEGVTDLAPVEHEILADRLEAGALLLAAAVTGGDVYLPQAPASMMEGFLMKLEDMGHIVEIGINDVGVRLKAVPEPRAVSFKTGPFPGFPTDLQAPMMAIQCLARGTSVIEETVFENRLLHVRELQKMGAQIKVSHNKATVTGVDELYGAPVIATDIRASCALVLAGFVAKGTTTMTGIHHWRRGYDALEQKLALLGAKIALKEAEETTQTMYAPDEPRLKQLS